MFFCSPSDNTFVTEGARISGSAGLTAVDGEIISTYAMQNAVRILEKDYEDYEGQNYTDKGK
jgi:hypothetical protein